MEVDPHQAGVREAKVARRAQPAATVLLLLGVPDRVVMEFMGRSTVAMKQRYTHVTDGLRREVADQLSTYVWKAG